MPIPPRYLHRQVNIHPREADVIAGEINKLIRQLDPEYTKLNSDFVIGTASWTGHQQMRFYDEAYPKIGKLSEFIQYLRTRENYYRTIMVWTWEDYENPEWTAYMRNQK